MRARLALLAPVVISLAVGFGAARLFADDGAKAPAPVAPQPNAKEEKVRKLLRLQGGEAIAKLTMAKMMDQFKSMPGLPAGFADTFLAKADTKQLMELGIPSYLKHLDESTIDATIAFYESPEGRKLSEQLPAITMEAMDAGVAWGRKLGADVARELAQKPVPPK